LRRPPVIPKKRHPTLPLAIDSRPVAVALKIWRN
jgi:hypothetical protein